MALRSPSCLLLVLLVVVQVVLEPAALAVCPPDTMVDVCKEPNCADCTSGSMVPDPEDCHGFYVCTGDGAYLPEPAQCPNGQVFNFADQKCQEPSEDDACPPCTLPHQECVYECPAEGTSLISSSNDCTTYYECSDGTATLMRCDAATPFFDGKTCQTDETLCCRCQPSCDEVGTYYVIDPIDCRKFWFCIGITTTTTTTTKTSGLEKAGLSFKTGKSVSAEKPSLHTNTSAPPAQPPLYTGTPKSRPEYSSTCDEGEVFDATTKECSATATCVTACPNVVNGTGCIDPFICLSTGFFAMCPNLCVQEYYHCTEVTWPEYKEPDLCFTGTVFHPDNHLCVNKDDCPYPEPESLRVTH